MFEKTLRADLWDFEESCKLQSQRGVSERVTDHCKMYRTNKKQEKYGISFNFKSRGQGIRCP